jgi:hypothetical protein
MKVSLLSLIAILASGTAATVVVKPIASIPFIVIGAIVVAIIIWTLSRGGRLALGRSRTGYLSFKLYGAKTRPRNNRRRPAATRAQNGPPSAGGVPPEGTPSPYMPRLSAGSTGRTFGVIAVVLLAFGGGVWGVAATVHSPANAHSPEVKQSPHAVQTRPVVSTSHLGPKATVEAYFAALNRHDWKAVWQIWHVATEPGHRSLYRRIAIGYRETKQDVITSIKTTGDHVHVRVLAYETTGAVQTYAFRYVVHRGHITRGWSRLLSTQRS